MRADVAEYDLVAPTSLAAVLQSLADEPGMWTPIAGGTELMVQLSAGRLQQKKLISIWNLPELRTLSANVDVLTIGAGCTYTDLRRDPIIATEFPLLTRAAAWTGGIANQNRGTIGGNIANASPAADSLPALLAYDAEVELISVRGARCIPYSNFHIGYKRTLLAADELILGVRLPRKFDSYFHYSRKVGARNAQAISKVAFAAVAQLQGNTIRHVRIAAASLLDRPFRCIATETALTGQRINDETVLRARSALTGEIKPIDDIRSTSKYRSCVAANLLEEFLHALAESHSAHELAHGSAHE